MEYVIRDLEEIKASMKNRTQTIDYKRLSKTGNANTSMQIVEDALSKVHCKYMLEIGESIVCSKPVNRELHCALTRTLSLLEKTKKEIANSMIKTGDSPITDEHLKSIMDALGYRTNREEREQ